MLKFNHPNDTLAFPLTVITKSDANSGAPAATDVYTGMTLRDYFAGQALAGLLANASYTNSARVGGTDRAEFHQTAAAAYLMADVTLAERSK